MGISTKQTLGAEDDHYYINKIDSSIKKKFFWGR